MQIIFYVHMADLVFKIFQERLGKYICKENVAKVPADPYVVTILVLVIISMRKKREHQPPQSLGLPYFREER